MFNLLLVVLSPTVIFLVLSYYFLGKEANKLVEKSSLDTKEFFTSFSDLERNLRYKHLNVVGLDIHSLRQVVINLSRCDVVEKDPLLSLITFKNSFSIATETCVTQEELDSFTSLIKNIKIVGN